MIKGVWNHLERSLVVQITAMGLGMLLSLAALGIAIPTESPILIIPAAASLTAWIFVLYLTIRFTARLKLEGRIATVLGAQILWSLFLAGVFLFLLWIIAATETNQTPSWQWYVPWFFPAMNAAAPVTLWSSIIIGLLVVNALTERARRRWRANLILSHLSRALNLNLFLPPLIEAAARSERGKVRRRLLDLHDHLDRGETIAGALGEAVPEIPVQTIRALAAAERIGRLQQNLPRWIRSASKESPDTTWRFYLGYPLIVLLLLAALAGGVFPIFLSPRTAAIFRGFHLAVPNCVQYLYAAATFIGVPGLPVLILVVGLVSLARYLTMLFEVGSVNPPMGGMVMDRVAWYTPGFHGYVRDRGMADVCQIVGEAVATGRTLEEGLDEASATQTNGIMRRRVANWAARLREGKSLTDAARAARMPSQLIGMLAAARDDRAMLRVMSFLTEHYRWRLNRTREILVSAYVPAVCCLLGVAVGFLEYCVVEPMTELWRVVEHMPGGF